MDRYTLDQVKELLNFKKDISAIRWCQKRGVTVAKQGNAKFVLVIQFDIAYYEPIIRDLQAQHGDMWLSYFQAYRAGDYEPHENPLPMSKTEQQFLDAS